MSEMRGWTRREALGILGLGAAAVALPEWASAQTSAFPKGAVIRTVLKDYAPEELAGGATLFHEHFQLATDFNQKFVAATAALTELPMVNSASGLRPLAPPIETNEPRRSFRSGQAARTSRIWPKNFSA